MMSAEGYDIGAAPRHACGKAVKKRFNLLLWFCEPFIYRFRTSSVRVRIETRIFTYTCLCVYVKIRVSMLTIKNRPDRRGAFYNLQCDVFPNLITPRKQGRQA
jgi:hypothetical protein